MLWRKALNYQWEGKARGFLDGTTVGVGNGNSSGKITLTANHHDISEDYIQDLSIEIKSYNKPRSRK